MSQENKPQHPMSLELAKTHSFMEEYNKNRKYKIEEKMRREEEEKGDRRREDEERRFSSKFTSLFSHNLPDLRYENPRLPLDPN